MTLIEHALRADLARLERDIMAFRAAQVEKPSQFQAIIDRLEQSQRDILEEKVDDYSDIEKLKGLL